MTQLFTALDYARISSIVFSPDYPGYKPNVVESPNGDGKKDDLKRYAHVSEKYLTQFTYRAPNHSDSCNDIKLLSDYLDQAHDLSIQVAITLGLPKPFWPIKKYGAIRVLEYDENAVTNPHTDFDLFTLMLYRNDETCFRYLENSVNEHRPAPVRTLEHIRSLKKAQELNSQVHFGEILEEIDSKSFRADDHEVVASNGPWQYSIVYFSIPSHESVLPSGITVGKWLDERIKRSRYER